MKHYLELVKWGSNQLGVRYPMLKGILCFMIDMWILSYLLSSIVVGNDKIDASSSLSSANSSSLWLQVLYNHFWARWEFLISVNLIQYIVVVQSDLFEFISLILSRVVKVRGSNWFYFYLFYSTLQIKGRCADFSHVCSLFKDIIIYFCSIEVPFNKRSLVTLKEKNMIQCTIWFRGSYF